MKADVRFGGQLVPVVGLKVEFPDLQLPALSVGGVQDHRRAVRRLRASETRQGDMLHYACRIERR